jgi:hypothetical protein
MTSWSKLKPKIIEILITAVVSALIAALQNFLTAYQAPVSFHANPELAGGIGAFIRTFWLAVKRNFC